MEVRLYNICIHISNFAFVTFYSKSQFYLRILVPSYMLVHIGCTVRPIWLALLTYTFYAVDDNNIIVNNNDNNNNLVLHLQINSRMLNDHVLHNCRSSGTHSEVIYNYIEKKNNRFFH